MYCGKMNFELVLLVLILISAPSRTWRYNRSVIEHRRLEASEPMVLQPNFEPEIPENCRNQSICEDVPNYPYKYIDQLLQNNDTLRNAPLLGGFSGAAGCKKNNDPLYVEICISTMKYVEAKAAQDVNGQWYFLVGRSGICQELCTSKQLHQSCMRPIGVQYGYLAICNQKLVKVPLAVLTKKGTIVAVDTDVFAGCWCEVTQAENPSVL